MNPDIVEVVARAITPQVLRYIPDYDEVPPEHVWTSPRYEWLTFAMTNIAQAALTAARPAILDEAAGIAEEYGQRDWFEVGKVVKQASRDIATAIRAAVKP